MRQACEPHDEWPARVAAGVRAAVDFFVDHPRLAQALVEVPDGESGRDHVAIVRRFSGLLGEGAPADVPAASTRRAVVEGISSVISTHVRAGRLHQLPDRAPELVYLALLPYLGFEEANRWAEATAS